jgi:arylsulfatase A-like enzyme
VDRRDFLKNCAAATAGGFVLSNRTLEVGVGSTRPNFIFFLADDMGWRDAGYQGGNVTTPNIDRLAKEGVELNQFYTQPVCTPTRACLLTGRYAFKTGTEIRFAPKHTGGMLIDERTLADALKEAGYWTVMLGKWHLGQWEKKFLPNQRGFDHHYGHYNGVIDYYKHTRNNILDWHRNGRPLVEEGYSTYLIAAEAERLIAAYEKAVPFFFYVPFNAPHGPRQAPQEVVQKYEQSGHVNPGYAATVECMDVAMGRILTAIEKRGLRENTIVMFCSDNGGTKNPGNEPLNAHKSAYLEGGVRVPAVISWPGKLKAGSVVNEPLHIVDVFPTFVKLAGGSLAQPLPLDGKDAWPTIAEGKPTPHEEIVYGLGAIRRGDWKLIEADVEYYGWKADVTHLYNIHQDPYEKMNLANDLPEKVKELRARLAYHATQARPSPERPPIPNYPPKVFGQQEQDMI